MKASVVSFSRKGGVLAERIQEVLENPALSGEPVQAQVWALPKYAAENGQKPVEPGLSAWCGERWGTDGLLIFVGACGIAVRTIAPHVRSKVTDPAVLVVDEGGSFVISLLSGHLGGANDWAGRLAAVLGAAPVITTATDVEGHFAVDVWAKRNHLAIRSMKLAKEVSAAVLAGEPVGFYCDGLVEGSLPPELARVESPGDWPGLLIAVSPLDLGERRKNVLRLVPRRCVCLGLGCRRGKDGERIKKQVEAWLDEAGIFRESLKTVASIDLKREEEGILSCCREWGLPFVTYSSRELAEVKGDFASSAFVAGVTGVDNVCERSAVLASGQGRLILGKRAESGVTAAAACGDWKVKF